MQISWSCWDMEKHLIETESQFDVLTLHKAIVHFRKKSCHVKIINFWLVLRINLLQLSVLAYNKLLWYKYQIISFLFFFFILVLFLINGLSTTIVLFKARIVWIWIVVSVIGLRFNCYLVCNSILFSIHIHSKNNLNAELKKAFSLIDHSCIVYNFLTLYIITHDWNQYSIQYSKRETHWRILPFY